MADNFGDDDKTIDDLIGSMADTDDDDKDGDVDDDEDGDVDDGEDGDADDGDDGLSSEEIASRTDTATSSGELSTGSSSSSVSGGQGEAPVAASSAFAASSAVAATAPVAAAAVDDKESSANAEADADGGNINRRRGRRLGGAAKKAWNINADGDVIGGRNRHGKRGRNFAFFDGSFIVDGHSELMIHDFRAPRLKQRNLHKIWAPENAKKTKVIFHEGHQVKAGIFQMNPNRLKFCRNVYSEFKRKKSPYIEPIIAFYTDKVKLDRIHGTYCMAQPLAHEKIQWWFEKYDSIPPDKDLKANHGLIRKVLKPVHYKRPFDYEDAWVHDDDPYSSRINYSHYDEIQRVKKKMVADYNRKWRKNRINEIHKAWRETQAEGIWCHKLRHKFVEIMRCYLDDPRLSTLGNRHMENPFEKVTKDFQRETHRRKRKHDKDWKKKTTETISDKAARVREARKEAALSGRSSVGRLTNRSSRSSRPSQTSNKSNANFQNSNNSFASTKRGSPDSASFGMIKYQSAAFEAPSRPSVASRKDSPKAASSPDSNDVSMSVSLKESSESDHAVKRETRRMSKYQSAAFEAPSRPSVASRSQPRKDSPKAASSLDSKGVSKSVSPKESSESVHAVKSETRSESILRESVGTEVTSVQTPKTTQNGEEESRSTKADGVILREKMNERIRKKQKLRLN